MKTLALRFGLDGKRLKRACLQGERVTLALIHSLRSFFPRRVYKAARVTRVGGLPFLLARVTLAGGLTFSLVNTPGRVTRLPGLTF